MDSYGDDAVPLLSCESLNDFSMLNNQSCGGSMSLALPQVYFNKALFFQLFITLTPPLHDHTVRHISFLILTLHLILPVLCSVFVVFLHWVARYFLNTL